MSFDPMTEKNVFSKVLGTSIKKAQRLVRLITGKDTILATPEHPFYVVDDILDGSKQGSWLNAGNLKKGLKVLLASGLLATVDNTFAFDTTATVYNFEVENTHTYYVGTEGVLVHNTYVAGTVNKIKTTLGTADAAKWTTFVNRVLGMNVPLAQRMRLYDEISNIANSTDPTDLIKFLNDFDGLEAFRKGLAAEPELVNIWRSYKFINGVEVLRFIKNGNLTTTELSRLTQIFNGGTELKGLVEAFGAVNDVNGLKNLLNNTRWTDDFITKLRSKLPRTNDYPDFANDLALTVMTTRSGAKRILDVAEDMLKNPERAQTIWKDVLQNSSINSESLTRLSTSEKFRFFMGQGNAWGKLVSDNIMTIPAFKSFLDRGYGHLTQINLMAGNGKNIIADDLLPIVVNEGGVFSYFKVVINDSKLSKNAPWTENQLSEIIQPFKDNPNLQYINFEVRSAMDIIAKNAKILPPNFRTGLKIRLYRQDVLKTIQNQSGGFDVINMNSIYFID